MNRSVLCSLLLISITTIFVPRPSFAQDESEVPEEEEVRREATIYGPGDFILGVDAGLFIPLFYTGGPDGIESANLSLGGAGHIHYGGYLNSNMTVGGEFGGSFSFSANDNTLYMLLIAGRYTYFLRSFPFEFPLSIAVGFNFSSFRENFKTDPAILPGVGFLWNLDSRWGFGFNVRYWWIPQIYQGPRPPAEDSRFGNFLSTTLSLAYRF